jgi:hypothetical protein
MSTAAARVRPARPSFAFALAGPADDLEIRRLLRDGALPGRIALSFEREPDALGAGSIEGHAHETIVGRDVRTGTLAGIASRAVRQMFVNGEPRNVGYLGQLRVAGPPRRLRSLIDAGFHFVRARRGPDDVGAYLVSLVDDNPSARRLLLDRSSPAMPDFAPLGRLTTFVLPVGRRGGVRPRRGAPAVRSATSADLEGVAECLQRNLARFQCAPVWDPGTLLSPDRIRGLALQDFVVVDRRGRVAGCAALWDQRAFRQVVVRGYEPALRRTRWIVNAAAPWFGLPRLPRMGEALAFACISHLAVDEDDPDDVRAIVAALRGRASRAGLDYVVMGAPAGHRLAAAVAGLGRHRAFGSELFMAGWPGEGGLLQSLDGRPPNPEVALL